MVSMNPRGIITVGIAIAFLAAVVPNAFTTLFAVNTSTWDAGVASLWVIIPLAIVATVIFFFLPKGTGGGGAT